MEFWFSEMHTDNVKASIRCEKQLYSGQSDFQRIDVFDSAEFGRFLVSNGSVIFSEKDEFIYDEMIVHVPMAVHPDVKHVLVIGGGDGGVARELSHYDEIFYKHDAVHIFYRHGFTVSEQNYIVKLVPPLHFQPLMHICLRLSYCHG